MLFSEYANLNCHEIYISYNLKSNMSIFDMNVISLKIFLYFVILILDLKKNREISIDKNHNSKIKITNYNSISLLIFQA